MLIVDPVIVAIDALFPDLLFQPPDHLILDAETGTERNRRKGRKRGERGPIEDGGGGEETEKEGEEDV